MFVLERSHTASCRILSNRAAFCCWVSISMKSTSIMPPISRKRSWRIISSAASIFSLYTVSARFISPTKLPVFTSITVMASVLSITRKPPDCSWTVRPFSCSKASVTPLSLKIFLPSYNSIRCKTSGEVTLMRSQTLLYIFGLSITILSTSSVR